MQRPWVDREATLPEVFENVSVSEALSSLKEGLITLSVLIVLWGGSILIFGTGKSWTWKDLIDHGVYGIPFWPLAGALLFLVFRFFHGTTWHQWDWSFYFPKLKTFGSVAVTVNILLCIWVWRVSAGSPVGDSWSDRMNGLLMLALWVLAPMPLVAFGTIANIGHKNLMAKREAEVTGNAEPSPG